MPDGRDHAYVARDRARAIEAGRISEFRNQTGGSQRPHTFDGHDQFAKLMFVDLSSDIARKVLKAPTQHLQIFTQVLDPHR